MKIWVDDIRPMPLGYNTWLKSVNEVIAAIEEMEELNKKPTMLDCTRTISILDLDHDAGDYVSQGGDYIKILDYMEEHNINIPIRIHSMNPVGVENMRRIIERNGWREIR